MIAGVLGGLGVYFNVDATVLRLVYLAITIFSGVLPGIIVYLFAIVIMPTQSRVSRPTVTVADDDTSKESTR